MTKISLIIVVGSSLLLASCSGAKDPIEVACENLSIKTCSKSKAHQMVNFQINQQIKKTLEAQSEKVNELQDALNNKINAYTSRKFDVDVNTYKNISYITGPLFTENDESIEGLRVFAAGELLVTKNSDNNYGYGYSNHKKLEVRQDGVGNEKYKQIKQLCVELAPLICRINYKATVDGVWVEKEGGSRELVGWISYEDVAIVSFGRQDVGNAIHAKSREQIFKRIFEENGNINLITSEIEIRKAITVFQ